LWSIRTSWASVTAGLFLVVDVLLAG
jgi:hypothetical protein